MISNHVAYLGYEKFTMYASMSPQDNSIIMSALFFFLFLINQIYFCVCSRMAKCVTNSFIIWRKQIWHNSSK